MANFTAFMPGSNTYTLTVGTSSTTAFQVVANTVLAANQFRVTNRGPNASFLTWSAPLIDPATGKDTGGTPTTTAIIPTAGNPPGTTQKGMWIQNGATEVFTLPPNSWFAAICAAAQSATLDFVSGEGL
jgi:hypothetical protein